MKIQRFVNSQLQSNSYILYCDKEHNAWIIDPGDVEVLIEFLNQRTLSLKSILITHNHYDHIYGINELREKYAGVTVYASAKSKDGMSSAKINGSYYAEMPFIIENMNISYVKHGDSIELGNGASMKIYETPGHNDDCICFFVENNLFTGDSLIPGIKVHLKAKRANKELAYKSVRWIIDYFDGKTMIYPGHKDGCVLKDAIFLYDIIF